MCRRRGPGPANPLTRLAEQGLIQSQPNKGFFVPIYTIKHIESTASLSVKSALARAQEER